MKNKRVLVLVLYLVLAGNGGADANIATQPDPCDGAIAVDLDKTLTWKAGDSAVWHDVYFGTDFDEVNDATIDSPEYMGRQDTNNWDPNGLEFETTYYWRIDEIDAWNTYKGGVWSFTTWMRGYVPSLVGWWKFDEGEGRTAYDSAGNNDGNLVGDPNWVAGRIGSGALDFDGNDAVYLQSSSGAYSPLNISSGNLTLSAWVRTTGAGGTIVARAKRYSMLYRMGVDTNKAYICKRPSGYDAWYLYTNEMLKENTWYHLAGVFDISNHRGYVYVDGVEDARGIPWSKTVSTSSSTKIGCGNDIDDDPFDGTIDEVMIYNRPLSAEDVNELYRYGPGGKAFNPEPADNASYVVPEPILRWAAGKDEASQDVYFGTSPSAVLNATKSSDEYKGNQAETSYNPGVLEFTRTYYWRIDEVGEAHMWKGVLWRFTVDEGKASNPQPLNGSGKIPVNAQVSWMAGNYATSHDVYLGTDLDAVTNADRSWSEYRANLPRDVNSYDAPVLEEATIYYWRVDAIGEKTYAKGDVWTFTTEGPLYLQVDLALPLWNNPNEVMPGTGKEGWWHWAAPQWADMYCHEGVWEDGSTIKPTDSGIDGSGIHVFITCGTEGQGGLHVKDLCRCSLVGDCLPSGNIQGQPIANTWYYAVDWAGPKRGDILLLLTDLSAGKYELISYHNHWEPGPGMSTRNCCRCQQPMPPMPSVTAQSLPPAPLPGYEGWALPAGTGTGVTAIEDAYDVPVTYVYFDDEVSRSVIKFETNGSGVLVIYEAPDWGFPGCSHAGREAGRGILNAFELILVEPLMPMCWDYLTQCHGDSDNSSEVNGSDFLALKNSWYKCYPEPDYDPCADFDRDGCVKGSDFLTLKKNWLKSVPADCPPGGTWPPR